MRIRIAIAAIILFEIFLLFLGCHEDGSSPVTPQPIPGTEQTLTDETIRHPSGGMTGSPPCLWGYYKVVYDAAGRTIDAMPLRGPAFAWNVVTFLQPPAGSISNMSVKVLDDSQLLDTGRIDVRVILHHPFPGQDMYDGFDVCGILLTEGSMTAPANHHLTYANPAVDPTLCNPDGYTRWMNPSEFLTGNVFGYEPGFWGTSESSENSGFVAGATLNPHKYFALGLGPSESLHDWLEDSDYVHGRGLFPAGATCARDYELLFPKVEGQIVFMFNYAVLANWAAPNVQPPSDPLKDFPREANAQYPLHIFVTDNSRVYHTADDAGGTLSFDIDVFDWGFLTNPKGVPGEVTKFTVWSDEPLVPGGAVEFLSTEVEWNSGFLASTSVATIEIPGAVPSKSGDATVWIEIESANPSSYDQGFDAEVPDDPLASYVRVPVLVANCPKAFLSGMSTNQAGKNSVIQDVVITGENFIDGSELGVWLEQADAGGEATGDENFKIYGTNVTYVDTNTITADFDLADAPIGNYGIGCVNGCGTVTTPDENYTYNKNADILVLPPPPVSIELSTGRTTAEPAPVDSLYVSWDPVSDAQYYKVYANVYDIYGKLLESLFLVMCADTQYKIPVTTILPNGGAIETWITSYAEDGSNEYESLPSRSGFLYYQGFEKGLGQWNLLAENSYSLRFVRSTVDASYAGVWGVKTYGLVPSYSSLWAIMTTPPIPEISGASKVYFEFLHKYMGMNTYNGYQVGWFDSLPPDATANAEGYHPIVSVAYGHGYPDDDSSALRTEYSITTSQDNNFRSGNSTWVGWYLSGFDLSAIIGDNKANLPAVALAGDHPDLMVVAIDEVAVLVY